MHKLLPFRQYDEKDVINLFSLAPVAGGTDYVNLKVGGSASGNGDNWSGTAVMAKSGNTLGGDAPGLSDNESYLGAVQNDLGHTLGQGSQYPMAGGQVDPLAVTSNVKFLGITLRATLAYDENMEKLLYYQRKLEELQAVLPKQAVPIATRGMFTLTTGASTSAAAIIDTSLLVGNGLISAANGKFGAAAAPAAGNLGIVLATGTNGGQNVALVQIAPR